jgi:hypothetical protein
MGVKESRGCCLVEQKESVFEENIAEFYRRGESYESPIPDEVCEFVEEQAVVELSTDVEKQGEMSEEPKKNMLNGSRIVCGSKKSR